MFCWFNVNIRSAFRQSGLQRLIQQFCCGNTAVRDDCRKPRPCIVRVTFHLLTSPAHDVDASCSRKMQSVQQFVRWGIHDGNMHHVMVCIQQYALITLAQCCQLCGIHLLSSYCASNRKTSSQACCKALSFEMPQLRLQPVIPLAFSQFGVMVMFKPFRLSCPVRVTTPFSTLMPET